jgi:hypothetical protein
MALDLSADHLLIDDPLTVSFYVKTGPTPPVAGAASVAYAQRNQETVDVQADGRTLLRQVRTVYHLWQAPLTAAGLAQPPKPGDVIADGGVRFTIDKVGVMDRDQSGPQRFRCEVVRE